MIGSSIWLLIAGTLMIVGSFFTKTSDYETYNIGLLQTQQNVLMLGICLFVSGIILMSAGFIKEAVEKLKEEKPVESKISELDKPNSIHPEKIGHGHI